MLAARKFSPSAAISSPAVFVFAVALLWVRLTPTRAAEALTAASGASPVAISEIHYHPPEYYSAQAGYLDLEFIELHNAGSEPYDLHQHKLSGSINYTFWSVVIPPRGFIVVANRPAAISLYYGLTNTVYGGYSNKLPNDAGVVRLVDPLGLTLAQVRYRTDNGWPKAADGLGHSLVLARPSYGHSDPRAWAASARLGGSPYAFEPAATESWRGVKMNEILARAAPPNLDFIELHNPNAYEANLQNCRLTDDLLSQGLAFPPGTIIPAGGYLALDAYALPFGLSDDGETLYLFSPEGEVIDLLRYPAQHPNVAWGYFPESARVARELSSPTPFTPNAPALIREVVISELFCAGDAMDGDWQFVELFNSGTNQVDLSGWALEGPIQHQIPAGTVLPAAGYLVIAKDKLALLRAVPSLSPSRVIGDFAGTLQATGELLVLSRPLTWVSTNGLVVTTNTYTVRADEVMLGTDGLSLPRSESETSSLELIDPSADNFLPGNWAEATTDQGSPWVNIEGLPVWRSGVGAPVTFQVMLLGKGECWLDDIQVLDSTGANLLPNSAFTQALESWQPAGSHSASMVEVNPDGDMSLRLRASSAGDIEENHVRAALRTEIPDGSNVRFWAKARHIRGCPRLVLRIQGGKLDDVVVDLPAPSLIGSPGFANSQAQPNAAPSIQAVVHKPVLPAGDEPVRVTAEIDDSEGLASVTCFFRRDPATNWTAVSMAGPENWEGTWNLRGLYKAQIPSQPAGSMVAFYIEAVDRIGARAVYPPEFTSEGGMIFFGATNSGGGQQQLNLWMTEANRQAWATRPLLDRHPIPVTFVQGERVIHGATAARAWGSSGTNDAVAGVHLVFPRGEIFRDSEELVLLPGTGSEQQAATLLARASGLPIFVPQPAEMVFPGTWPGPRLFQLVLHPGQGYSNAVTGEPAGHSLFRFTAAYERDANNALALNAVPTLSAISGPEGWDATRYRWTWRQEHGHVLQGGSLISNLVTALAANQGPDLLTRTDYLVNWDQWLRLLTLERVINNTASFGYVGTGDLYGLFSPGGRWQLLPAAFAQPFYLGGDFGGTPPAEVLFYSRDTFLGTFFQNPAVQRNVWDFAWQILNTPTSGSGTISNWMTARRNWFLPDVQRLQEIPLTIANTNLMVNSNGLVLLHGTAPIGSFNLEVNGSSHPVVWTSVSNWQAEFAVTAGATDAEVSARSEWVQEWRWLPIMTQGPVINPSDALVVSEIFPSSDFPAQQFIEIHNGHPTASLDLSGFTLAGKINGRARTGEVLGPGDYGLLVANEPGFRTAFGWQPRVVGDLLAPLNPDEGVIALADPQGNVVHQARYGSGWGWAGGPGGSYQLRNGLDGGSRPVHWALVAPPTPGGTNKAPPALFGIPSVWLNEVLRENVNGPGDRWGELDPWVEIYNSGIVGVSLVDLGLADIQEPSRVWFFPASASLGAQEHLTIFLDGQPEQSSATEWHASFRLGSWDAGVCLVRRTSGGILESLDDMNVSRRPPGSSLASLPDGQPFFRIGFLEPTGGRTNGNTPLINEWMASNRNTILDPIDRSADDWFEIFNRANGAVDFAGFRLSDQPSFETAWPLPDGAFIPANGHLLAWADNQPYQNLGPFSGTVHTDFNLDRDGDQLFLFGPDGRIIDHVEFGYQERDRSGGRYPDGFQILARLGKPSPGSQNTTNFPPMFRGITDHYIPAGQQLVFDVGLTDPNGSLDGVNVSVLPGAPPGVFLSGYSVVWTPRLQESGGTFYIPMQATDAGIPPMSTSNNFRVYVQPPLAFECLSSSMNTLTFRWLAHPGKTYELQWTDRLAISGTSYWTKLQTVTASNLLTMTWFTNLVATRGAAHIPTNRFFRVIGH